MKRFLVIILSLILGVSAIAFTACDDNNGCGKKPFEYSQFGEFSYKGKTLLDYAVKTITAPEAKKILSKTNEGKRLARRTTNSNVMLMEGSSFEVKPSESYVSDIMQKYAGCKVTTHYYVEDSEEKQTKVDIITGMDFKNALLQNQLTPFNQLIAKNIVVFGDLIDYMEEKNREFAQSEAGKIAPFKNVFTYHEDINGNLIIQTRDYAEIASSVGGGIGASYRQDTEIVYDESGKMVTWQTSLGLKSSTPRGTLKEGYILEISIEWNEKD